MSKDIYCEKYKQLIEQAKGRVKPDCYCEYHHILPKALGGSNNIDNLVLLTAADHFIAHFYLWKIYGNKMTYAFYAMYNKNKRKLNENLLLEYADEYQKVKEEFISNNMKGDNNPMSKIDRHGINNPMFGKVAELCPRFGISHSEETKAKISQTKTGSKHSEETKKKIGIASKNRKHSEETKEKIKLSWTKRRTNKILL